MEDYCDVVMRKHLQRPKYNPAVYSRHPRNSDSDNNYLIKVFFGISPFVSSKKYFLKVELYSLVKTVSPSYKHLSFPQVKVKLTGSLSHYQFLHLQISPSALYTLVNIFLVLSLSYFKRTSA